VAAGASNTLTLGKKLYQGGVHCSAGTRVLLGLRKKGKRVEPRRTSGKRTSESTERIGHYSKKKGEDK